MAFPEQFGEAASNTRNWIGVNFGWFYVIATTFFLILAVVLMLSRYGNIRLGPDSSRPEFSTLAWFAMLFTAGMGIGLVFWGVAEPAFHAASDYVAEATGDPATGAMQFTLFHWGFHPWAVYIVLGLSLGYFCFRKGLPMRPASALYPLIGNRIYGWIGNLIDILAVFGTLFGLATSLGLGTMQVNTGLSQEFGIPVNPFVQSLIILLITAVAVVSVVAGIDKGIRRLSVINLWLAAALLLTMFLIGPKLWMLSMMYTGAGEYLQNLVQMSLNFSVSTPAGENPAETFATSWTIFYWGWWISWSPFVGMFLARISYGRTIRQFIVGTLFAPVGVSVVWFGVFGGTGIYYDMFRFGEGDKISDVANEAEATFHLIDALPLPGVFLSLLALLTMAVVVVFFITSSDSGSLVVDMLTNGGDPHPVRLQRIFWATMEGVITIVLLVIGGSAALLALQAASVSTGLPFAIVLVVIGFSLIKALRSEDPTSMLPEGFKPRVAPPGPGTEGAEAERVPVTGPGDREHERAVGDGSTAGRAAGEESSGD
ncbi:choline/glycine/proline betaine transport protein [Nocardiopsis mwathae]|uniref:Choline/glycine/proline betaine transport protein n=1 Tax=Nocardiopsis mwathae TaxID=1472723 RepID=A0A7W9YIP1_9ACTN|nr:choline/glycine/proline betaine transport protein [Nocardiopsis mwathae]